MDMPMAENPSQQGLQLILETIVCDIVQWLFGAVTLCYERSAWLAPTRMSKDIYDENQLMLIDFRAYCSQPVSFKAGSFSFFKKSTSESEAASHCKIASSGTTFTGTCHEVEVSL